MNNSSLAMKIKLDKDELLNLLYGQHNDPQRMGPKIL